MGYGRGRIIVPVKISGRETVSGTPRSGPPSSSQPRGRRLSMVNTQTDRFRPVIILLAQPVELKTASCIGLLYVLYLSWPKMVPFSDCKTRH